MKELRKRWRTPIYFACMVLISVTIYLPRSAHYSHLLAAGGFFVLSLMSGELRRLILGLSLCLANIILVFVSVSTLTEIGIYLIALVIGLALVVTENRMKQRQGSLEPHQPSA